MESSEEMREALVEMQREVERLQTDASHANLVLRALEALLVQESSNPFSGVFAALKSVFNSCHAVALVEAEAGDGSLECMAADPTELLFTQWKSDRFFRRVLGGRVAATFNNEGLEEWRQCPSTHISPLQPALYLPLRVRNRRGLLILLRALGEAGYDRSDVQLARKFALLASHALATRAAHQHEEESQRLRNITERLQDAQAALVYRANHDALTDLPNRSFMQELVERKLSRAGDEARLALAFVDLDNFKQINDAYSHAVGDTFLKRIAVRVRDALREQDEVGRISGDEFLILFDGFEARAEVEVLAERVQHSLGRPMSIEGVEACASASLGLAFYPDHGTDYDTLRRSADTAMYRAKSTIKGSVACFDEEMGEAAANRLQLEQRLREALRRGQFRAAFQPKFDLCSMRTIGFEALARWIDDEGKVHSPSTFIKAADEFGLLDDIARAVLADVSRSLSRIDMVFSDQTNVSINISAGQASDPVFMNAFALKILATGQPSRFTLEVTEDAFVAASTFETQILPHLRQIGARVSIDDFGTGYSSLSALADITADELKVDRSFITDIHQRPRSQSILRGIESLSVALGMQIVAEGVERKEELDYLLKETSIRLAQGYLFSQPLLLEDLIMFGGSNNSHLANGGPTSLT